MLSQKMIDRLKKLAVSDATFDFDDYDIYNGNYDDAYQYGFDDGEIDLARDILRDLKINFSKEDREED